MPAAVLVGLSGSAVLVVMQTAVQWVTPAEVLGRVGAVLFTGEAVATFVGAFAGPVLAEVTSPRTVAYAACAVTLASAVYAVGSTPSVHQAFARSSPLRASNESSGRDDLGEHGGERVQ